MNKKANLNLVMLSVVAIFALGGIAIMHDGGATGAVMYRNIVATEFFKFEFDNPSSDSHVEIKPARDESKFQGDANSDGKFESQDLIQIFKANDVLKGVMQWPSSLEQDGVILLEFVPFVGVPFPIILEDNFKMCTFELTFVAQIVQLEQSCPTELRFILEQNRQVIQENFGTVPSIIEKGQKAIMNFEEPIYGVATFQYSVVFPPTIWPSNYDGFQFTPSVIPGIQSGDIINIDVLSGPDRIICPGDGIDQVVGFGDTVSFMPAASGQCIAQNSGAILVYQVV
jgi:hypothetical protein